LKQKKLPGWNWKERENHYNNNLLDTMTFLHFCVFVTELNPTTTTTRTRTWLYTLSLFRPYSFRSQLYCYIKYKYNLQNCPRQNETRKKTRQFVKSLLFTSDTVSIRRRRRTEPASIMKWHSSTNSGSA